MQQEISILFDNLHCVLLDTYQGEIPAAVTKKYPAPKRARLHYTSRLALQGALKMVSERDFLEYNELEIINHQYLKEDQKILVSISHTNDFAVASVSDSSEFSSIGVDLELSTREIKEGIQKFYINEFDQIKNTLKLWCIKEAAFKAISPLYKGEKTLVLKDINIFNDGTFHLDQFEELSGFWKLESKEDKLLTHAIILKN